MKRMKRRGTVAVLVMILLCTMMPSLAYADVTSGEDTSAATHVDAVGSATTDSGSTTIESGDWVFSIDEEDSSAAVTGYTGKDESVHIPKTVQGYTVTGISRTAFDGSSVTSISIPESITDIEKGSFENCENLMSLSTIVMNPVYSSSAGVLFNKERTELICCPPAKRGPAYTVPDGVQTIDSDAFSNCSNLEQVTMPKGLQTVGAGALSSCSNLKSVIFKGDAPAVESGAFPAAAVMYYPDGKNGWTEPTWEGYQSKKCLYIESKDMILTDVGADEYFATPVQWGIEQNITQGTSETTFNPYAACTRAEAVTFLWRTNGSPEPDLSNNPFSDIDASQYYYKAVLWACQNQITSGVSSSAFNPNGTVTRAETVTFLWRCRRLRASASINFQDVGTGDFFYYPVRWAVEKGITSGVDDVTFSPYGLATRGQVITFLQRACQTDGCYLDPSQWQIIYPAAEHVLDEVGHSLRAAFNWSASMTYYGHNRYMPDTAAPGIEWYANYGFTNKRGNCYVMASTFYEMAVNLGYKPRQMSGKVPLRVGGLGPHSWVEITINGTNYVFDPDFTEETGRNGYMIHYGQSGTWRYQSYSAMSL
ncbi:MAG: S-layer homology domain-containing protein [Anaerovoracaceae bacterium]